MSTKRIAAVQSSYIPWKGYFDLINSVDEFVLLDIVQYTRRDWRSRNRIKAPGGTRWITIPIDGGGHNQRIDEALVSDPGWRQRHWDLLRDCYHRAPHFATYSARLRQLYLDELTDPHLSLVNRRLLEFGCSLLGIETRLSRARDYEPRGERTERLVDLCRRAGATHYLSGPAARAYLDERLFEAAGIELEWMSYEGYPVYEQLHPPFEHSVTVLDLLFHVGPEAPSFMLSFGERRAPGESSGQGIS